MRYQDPLKTILAQTRSHWDSDGFRPEARRAFHKALQCRTPALGAEVYASAGAEKIVYHTCKSRACPSCGHRATVQWQRERWAALPDVPYKGITFTMPDVLWKLFRDNRALVSTLPALAAKIIEAWIVSRHGLRVGVIAIPHTFNGRLEFNSHVHTMVTAGGFCATSGTWVPSVYFDNEKLMEFWRDAVIKLLRTSHDRGLLRSEMPANEIKAMLREQGARWWSVNIQSFKSRDHFLRYAGRYVRRPPIAQRRVTFIGNRLIIFWTNDKKLHRRVETRCSPEEFVDRWAQHIPRHYEHAIRCFGLMAPREVNHTLSAVFASTGQKRRSRPRSLRWSQSIMRDFKKDPLLDQAGNRMRWARRLAPEPSK